MIGYKLKYVLLPKMREEKGKELRNCNLNQLLVRGFMGSSYPMLDARSHIEFKFQCRG